MHSTSTARACSPRLPELSTRWRIGIAGSPISASALAAGWNMSCTSKVGKKGPSFLQLIQGARADAASAIFNLPDNCIALHQGQACHLAARYTISLGGQDLGPRSMSGGN